VRGFALLWPKHQHPLAITAAGGCLSFDFGCVSVELLVVLPVSPVDRLKVGAGLKVITESGSTPRADKVCSVASELNVEIVTVTFHR
jgi:hypothetical protein